MTKPLSPERLEKIRTDVYEIGHIDPIARYMNCGELLGHIYALQEQLDEARAEIAGLETQIETMHEIGQDLIEGQNVLREQIDSAKHQSRLMSAEEHRRLQEQVKQLTAERDDWKAMISTNIMHVEMNILREQVKQLTADRDSWKESEAACDRLYSELQQKHDLLTDRVKQLMGDRDEELEATIALAHKHETDRDRLAERVGQLEGMLAEIAFMAERHDNGDTDWKAVRQTIQSFNPPVTDDEAAKEKP